MPHEVHRIFETMSSSKCIRLNWQSPTFNIDWGSNFCGYWTHHTNTKNAVTMCGASWRTPPAAEVLEPGQESDILHYFQHCDRHYYLPNRAWLGPFTVKGGRVESTERLTRDLQNHSSIFLLLHAFFSSQTLNHLVSQFNFIHANILGGVGYSLWLLVTCSDSFPSALNGTSVAKTACYFAQVTCVMYCLSHSGGWRRLGERIFLFVRKINYVGGDLYSLLMLRQENLRYLIS